MGDTLTAAIAGTERGEVWEHSISGALWLTQDHTGITGVTPFPLTGWRRVEPELRCPRCGEQPEVCEYLSRWTVVCPGCDLRDGRPVCYPYATEAEAREAWSRIGGLRWRKPEEWREGNGEALALWMYRNGYALTYRPVNKEEELVAFVYVRDLPRPPPQAKE